MRLLLHPVVVLVAILVSAASALHALFFWQAERLWHFARVVADADVTPCARFAMRDRDGAEPYALIACVFLLSAVASVETWVCLSYRRVEGPWPSPHCSG
jgi:hypothetical protein